MCCMKSMICEISPKIKEHFNMFLQPWNCLESGPVHMDPGQLTTPGQALPRVHMMICCPGATLPRVNFIAPG